MVPLNVSYALMNSDYLELHLLTVMTAEKWAFDRQRNKTKKNKKENLYFLVCLYCKPLRIIIW